MILRGSNLNRDTNNKNINNFIYGGLSGIFSRTIVAPLDRVKIIMQITKNTNNNFISVTKDIIKKKI